MHQERAHGRHSERKTGKLQKFRMREPALKKMRVSGTTRSGASA
jgi:hypothetical protein